ncbi:MAG: sugar phosphate isomerase/epimerase [Sphingomonadales bacterium]|nr:sugar phosphate isomerase/epimerase [Sphingomonadales bacterium]
MTGAPPLLCLASGVLPEHPAETVAEAAAAAGFPAFGVRLEPAEWSDRRAAELSRRAADAGLVVLDAEVLWLQPGPLDPALLRLVDLAAIIGARNLLAVSSDPDPAATAAKFAALCDHAAPYGLPVSLEFGRFTRVCDLAAACAVITAADRPNARLLIDPLHLLRSGGTPEEVAAVPRRLFAYAQFCDAGPDAPAPEDFAAIRAEALDGRRLPGEGALPLAALLAALPPGLPLSVELRARALREGYPDPVDRARHLLAATRAWFARHGPGAG